MIDKQLAMFRNAVGVDIDNGVAIPRRFTKAQLVRYQRLGEGLYYNASGCACIELDFITDAPVVRVDYIADRYKRTFTVWDIYEDGVLCQQLRVDGYTPLGTLSYRRQKTEVSRITICLPYACRVGITNVEAGDWQPAPLEPKLRYLALGDSITQGFDSDSASVNYVRLVARHYQADVLNCGVGGFWYDADSLDHAPDYSPDLITVAYGTNDQGHWRLPEIQLHIDAYYERLTRMFPHAVINVISPIWRGDFITSPQLKANIESITRIIRDKAAEYRLNYIDGMTLTPHLSVFMGDRRVHPSSTGFLLYAANLIPQLKTSSRG